MNLTLFSIFTAGFLTFFTPCVLPLIPIYLLVLAGGRNNNSKNNNLTIFLKGVAFSFGFILVFSILGALFSGIGGILKSYHTQIMIFGGIVILIFGLEFLNIIQIPILNRTVKINSKIQTKIGFLNAFFMGVIFGSGWSPCIGPILGSILTYTATATINPIKGMLLLSIYGTGFAVPFLITALFADKSSSVLKRFNKLIPVFEKITGIFLLVMSVYVILNAMPSENNTVSNKKNLTNISVIKSSKNLPTMIEFYSKKCHICKSMEPIVSSIFNRCQNNKIELKKIDISEPNNLLYVKKYRIIGVPTFIFFNKKGKEVARLVGEQTASSLYQEISILRKEPCSGFKSLEDFNMQFSTGSVCLPNQECGK